MTGGLAWPTADLRLAFCMTDQACTEPTNEDAVTVGGITAGSGTIDEFDGSGYSGAVALTGEAVTPDTTNNRGESFADDLGPTVYGNGTRQLAGVLLVIWQGTIDNSVPIAWIDTVSGTTFPFNPGGGTVEINWDAEGILQTV